MEAFKFYWALRVAKKTRVPLTGLIRGFQKGTDRNGNPVTYGFEELLTEACHDLGLAPQFTFFADRNAMFHSGAPAAHQSGSSDAWLALRPELERLYRQIDDILLRILEYQGPVHRWDTPRKIDKFT